MVEPKMFLLYCRRRHRSRRFWMWFFHLVLIFIGFVSVATDTLAHNHIKYTSCCVVHIRIIWRNEKVSYYLWLCFLLPNPIPTAYAESSEHICGTHKPDPCVLCMCLDVFKRFFPSCDIQPLYCALFEELSCQCYCHCYRCHRRLLLLHGRRKRNEEDETGKKW